MENASEITVLQEGPVKVTNRRTIIGTITYSMAEISSVNLTRRARSKRALWIAAAGGFCVLWSVVDQTGYYAELFNIGVFLLLIGIALLVLAKPSYAVQIGSATGTHNILRSTDPIFVHRIVEAMNEALGLR